MSTKKDKKTSSQRGFTLLLAALVASIVLMLGSSIFTIAQKQVALSSIGRDSQFAFYAADAGAECALYYDIRAHAFPAHDPATPATVICDKDAAGADLSAVTTVTSTSDSATSTFSMNLFARDIAGNKVNTGMNCIQVTIAKNPTAPFTVIHADGYSVSCETITASGRALQRSVELRY
ncbi:hypothetical protein K8R03_03585 [Candidatus Kaiserbacteria bacterium]|nr:hypothetical protein [Candidatus Kaiserbacteria bacterium]